MSAKVEGQTPLLTAGRYRVERLIARGGMGAVYLARHIDLHREVALKILSPSPDMDDSGSFEERFRLEAETLAALNHPNIVTLYDYGQTEDGRYFLALEYIDGPRFTDLLRQGPLAPADTVRLILQVCRALRYAHRRGVVHRDLKPSNLLTWRDDEGEEHVKVVDFGLVKVLEDDQSLTRAGLILGSPHCMAPEQIRGDEIDHRADIYAIGVLLFRAVTGTWPFHGETSTATMIAHINNPIPRFSALDLPHEVSPLLEDAIRRCLAKRPDDRYPDVGQLMADLRRSIGVDASLTLSSGHLGRMDTLSDQGGPSALGLDEPTEGATVPSMHSAGVTAPLPPAAAQERSGNNSRALMLLLLLLLVVVSAGGGVMLSRLTDSDSASGGPDGASAEAIAVDPLAVRPADSPPSSTEGQADGPDADPVDASGDGDAGEGDAAAPAEAKGGANEPEAAPPPAPRPEPEQTRPPPKPRQTEARKPKAEGSETPADRPAAKPEDPATPVNTDEGWIPPAY